MSAADIGINVMLGAASASVVTVGVLWSVRLSLDLCLEIRTRWNNLLRK